jgi:hypothetical protein
MSTVKNPTFTFDLTQIQVEFFSGITPENRRSNQEWTMNRIEYNNFIFQIRSPRGAFIFNSHDCLTYIKQQMTAKSVLIKD